MSARGADAENLAAAFLERAGLKLVERNYRCRFGEIDLIARDGATLVFVEVKTRDGHEFGDAAEAITGWKRRRLVRIALDYMMRHQLSDCPCRFDVVSIHIDSGAPVIALFQNAFDAPGY